MPDQLQSTRVLVTGGAGFIGSALVWGLNQRGIERIVIADRLGSGDKWRNLAPLRFEDYMEAGDLLPRLARGDLGDFDVVLHMGACSSTLERDASYLARNNFEFTKLLCEWSLSRECRFVYASSAATYGDGAAGMSDRASLDGLRPLNAYGYSKQIFDQWAAGRGLLSHVMGLKFFNVFGPNEAHKGDMRSLVQKAYEQVRDTGLVRLFKSYRPEYADGEQRRDFVYVKDVVAMALHLALDTNAAGLFNVGAGEAHSWIELATALFGAMERTPQIEFIDMPESMRGRYQYYTCADVERVRAAGYGQPMTPLTESVADYVRNYLNGDKRLGD